MIKMLRIVFACFLFFVFVSSAHAVVSETPSSGRPECRIGLKENFIYPASDKWLVKNHVMEFILEVDVRRNDRLDTGFRLGYSNFSADTADFNASYDLYQFGFGGRYYLNERKRAKNIYETISSYLVFDINLYLAAKYAEFMVDSPSTFSGPGGKAGIGLEYLFGPHFSGLVEVSYLMTSLSDSNKSTTLPLEGVLFTVGIRMTR